MPRTASSEGKRGCAWLPPRSQRLIRRCAVVHLRNLEGHVVRLAGRPHLSQVTRSKLSHLSIARGGQQRQTDGGGARDQWTLARWWLGSVAAHSSLADVCRVLDRLHGRLARLH